MATLLVGQIVATASRRVMVPVIVACFALPVGRLFVDDQFDAFLDLDGGGGHRRDDRSRDAPAVESMGDLKAAEVGLAEKAATDERQRIAREVHDVIAHSMTVTMLHVTAARLAVARGDDDAATEALLEAERAGRESLNEIRHTVGLLRTEPDGGIEAPQPGAGDIVQLVDGFAEAGVDVRLAVEGGLGRVSPPVGLTLFRVVQESLANAVRHQPGSSTLGERHRRRRSPCPRAVRGRQAPTRQRLRPRQRDPGDAGAGRGAARIAVGRPRGPKRVARRVPHPGGIELIRVLLVDDQPLVRAGLVRILEPEPDLEIVGECADGDEVEAAVAAHAPDVILMDVRMKRMDGAEATRRVRQADDAPAVLILTTFDDDQTVATALAAGAAGFLLKDAPGRGPDPRHAHGGLGRCLARPRGGGPGARRLPHDRAAPRAVRRQARRAHRPGARRPDADRSGASNAEIGSTLFISDGTVKTHIGHIFTKLGLRDRAAAIVFAFDQGLVEPGATGRSDRGLTRGLDRRPMPDRGRPSYGPIHGDHLRDPARPNPRHPARLGPPLRPRRHGPDARLLRGLAARSAWPRGSCWRPSPRRPRRSGSAATTGPA